jgi:hypothetical protein
VVVVVVVGGGSLLSETLTQPVNTERITTTKGIFIFFIPES